MPSELNADHRDRLALALIPGLGPRLTAALLNRFNTVAAVRQATANELQTVPHIGAKLSEQFAAALRTVDVAAELQLMHAHNVRLVSIDDDDFPIGLKQIPDMAHLLFIRGEIIAADAKAIAIVGSREHTAYGRRITERLAAGLARAGYTVVSGLARGIDGIAHRATLEAGGRTIAVLAGGLSRIYPPEHAELANEVANHGALITETPMKVEIQPGMFPARNRLISGLSRGVIVVEAHERSGALITARHAAEQGREVFVVPGPIDSSASAGCLKLLRTGARPIRDVDDLLQDLEGIPAVSAKPVSVAPAPELDGDAKRIWDALSGGPRFIDDLSRELGIAVQDLGRALMQLELKRIVRRLPGSQYERR